MRRIEFFEPRVTRLVEMVLERLRVLSEKPNVPDVVVIALGSEKGGGGFTERTRDSPFEEFIGCAKREAY